MECYHEKMFDMEQNYKTFHIHYLSWHFSMQIQGI